ncbi:hypothetical protein EJ05DRAFT_234234 [Pseudovirgaria hyperparasitica]|uniref:Uncharacterized protein n=1 Tax=Pseudovirgaria hyperparasitica TaxID=470096 RepID=A0A6A6VT18_9PEZI|nr:uncharacterized protein EJ05DRAFT_234234 [Pseudovirgaria hyperparasitica]KAF2752926.1 hypothetical protein EJ05DRAFT_234234 [Pseudovirgaria hyperparasitica]
MLRKATDIERIISEIDSCREQLHTTTLERLVEENMNLAQQIRMYRTYCDSIQRASDIAVASMERLQNAHSYCGERTRIPRRESIRFSWI